MIANADYEGTFEEDRCPIESDGRHRWQGHEPPEWMLDEAAKWDDAAWESWYDEAGQTCWSCGMTND